MYFKIYGLYFLQYALCFFEIRQTASKMQNVLRVKSNKTFQEEGMLVKMNKAYCGSLEIVQKSLYLQIK